MRTSIGSTERLPRPITWLANSWAGRATAAYVAIALASTALAAILGSVAATRSGLVREFYPHAAFAGTPLFRDRSKDISLRFLGERPDLPRRNVSVRWMAYWLVPRAEAVDLYAGGDDAVTVYVDRRLVLRRDAAHGTSAIARRLDLTSGVHTLVVRYQQLGGTTALSVLKAPAGGSPSEFAPWELLPTKPTTWDRWRAWALDWLTRLQAFIRLAPPVVILLVLGLRRRLLVGTRPTAREVREHLVRLAIPSLLGPVMVFLVGPHTIYAANQAEFNVTFSDIAWPALLEAVGLGWLLLFAAGAATLLLSDHVRRAYVALLLAFGLLLWIQGTLMVADYGPMYGEGLNLHRFARRAPYEAAIWIAGLSIAIVWARRISARAPMVSGLFIGLEVAALTVSGVGTGDRTAESWSEPPAGIYRLSHSRNVIHVVLDGFLSEVFAEAIDQDQGLRQAFAGFVFFPDHLGAFPTTRASMPAMLTGVTYRNRVPFDEFLANTTHRQSISTVLAKHGYEVHSITFDSRDHPVTPAEQDADVVRYKIPTPYGTRDDYVRFADLELVDLSLFRQVPQGLKSYVYNDDNWLVRSHYRQGSLQSERARDARPSNHVAFLNGFIARLAAVEQKPVYTFVHVALPHPPAVLDANCGFLGNRRFDRGTYTAQARCGILVVRHLLDRLRSLGVYDSSVILLTSDHGWSVPRPDHPLRALFNKAGSLEAVAMSAMPLLVVKPSGGGGPLRVSPAHTAITDVPATVVGLLGLPNPFSGQSALDLDPAAPRRRTFAYHSWSNAGWKQPYLDRLFVFSVDGPVLEGGSWSLERTIADPTSGDPGDGGEGTGLP